MVPQTMGLRDGWPADVSQQTEIAGVAFFPQEDYQCGPAALATALDHAGAKVIPEDLVKLVYLPARQGSLQVEMLSASRRYSRVSYQLEPRFADLLREVAAGHPVVVLQDNGIGPVTKWHYAVVVGFDYARGELYLRSGTTERRAVPFTVFEYTWKKSGYWAMVAMPPEKIPITATETRYLAAVTAMERVGDAPSVRAAYGSFLERWPSNEVASVGLANQHYALGQLDATRGVLLRAVERNPASAILLNNLAYTLSQMGRNDEALRFIDRAVLPESSPFAASVQETRALILQRLNKPL